MTTKWLCQTSNPPRIPIFYALRKIHKPTQVGRPIFRAFQGQQSPTTPADSTATEVISQRYSQLTSLISRRGLSKVAENAILVSMEVTSFYTNIPQEEGIQTVCEAYDAFYKGTRLLAQALRLILQENSSQFCGKNYPQTPHGTTMGTKMVVAFANQIFMGIVATERF